MAEQRAYEGLGKKALENLCSEKRISFRKKATKEELRNLLIASDQGARAQPLPEAAEEAEKIRMQRVTSKLQFEHEQKLADLRLLEKHKIAELEREREKEAAEREKEAAEREKEADQRKKEADEREERARKGRLELLAAEQETHRMEQETARLQLQVMEERRKSSPPGTPLPPRHEKNWERMCPIYNDTEDIEEFLSTFERLCNLYQIPEGQRMPVLLTRLTGKAREVFNDLGEQEALNYERFKDSVLRRFKVTPESYRVKFREFKMPKDCTFVECAHKLMGFVKKWVMGAKVHGSFEKLLDLITLEQFLDIVPDNVRAAVCDRDPESVLRAAEIADAHTQNRAREGCKTPGKTDHHSPQFKRREGFKNKPDSSKGVQGGPEGRNSHPQQVTCYRCGMLGHMRPDCPTLKGSPKPATPNATANANPVVVNSQASHTEPSIGALCANAVSVVSEGFDLKTHIKAKYGKNNAEFISSAEVNGVRCMAWRDTAADITLVKASLVRKEDYLPGEDVTVVALSKYFVRVPLAKIHLKWKGWEGTMVVGVKDIIPKDIMIGNDIKAMVSQVNTNQAQERIDPKVVPMEGFSKSLSLESSCLAVNEVSECLSNVSEVNLELDQAKGEENKEILDEPRQSCELMALSSQQFGKARRVEDGCPYTLSVSCAKNSDSEGNVPVSVRGVDLPMEEATPVSKQLSVNSPVCWDKGNEIPDSMSSKGKCVSNSFLSVEQTEGAFRPVMVESNLVVSELVLDSTKAQEGNGPKFASAGENGPVTRLHPVSGLAKSQRPNSSVACILPVAHVWLEKGVTTLSDQGDTLARAQGEQKGNLVVLPTDSLTTCSKKEKIPKLVCGKEKGSISNLLSRKSMGSPERGLCRNLPDGPKVILNISKIQTESVVAQESVPLEQALGEEGKGRISVRGELLLRKAPGERNPHGTRCKQFPAIEGCESDLIKEVSVPSSQKLSVVKGSTNFPCKRSSVGSFEKVSEEVKVVKGLRHPYNQVAVWGQLVGETMVLEQECLLSDSLNEQFVLQGLRTDLVTDVSEQSSFMAKCLRMRGRGSKLSPADSLDLCGISLRQSPALEMIAVTNMKTGGLALVWGSANYLPGWERKDLLIAVSKEGPPHQPVNSVKQEKSGFDPAGQGGKRKLNFAKGSHRLTLKCPNSNGIEPKGWHDKHDCRWTLAMNLLLLLNFVINVLLLPQTVKIYNVPNLLENSLNMLKGIHENTRYVKRPCYTGVSQAMHINNMGTFHRGKDIPDLMCCMKRKTEAHYHIAFMAKCQDSWTMKNINICIYAMLIGFQTLARACMDKVAVFFSSWQDHMAHTGTMLPEQIQSTIVLTKCYLEFVKRFNHVIEHDFDEPFLLYTGTASNPILAVVRQNPGWGALGMQSVMFVSSLPASILRWGCDVIDINWDHIDHCCNQGPVVAPKSCIKGVKWGV
ncbi:uncharacterized protein LOC135982270 [Chrysemys picta bellii]|uniref:uncharacterized protein LOC135982270 n=1 Tax=Chrysemys picta bellii TaxID=8478 RepID=UPI0032B2877A